MNNEPVAWMEIEHGGFTEYKVWREPVSSKSIPLYTHPVKEQDALRYQWLRTEFEAGRETYIGESMPSGEKLDEYIDEKLRKAQEK